MVDWIHEYTKERVRKRNLASRPGVLNRIKFIVDASQEWIILTCTGTHLIPDPSISLFKYPFQFHPRVEFFQLYSFGIFLAIFFAFVFETMLI